MVSYSYSVTEEVLVDVKDQVLVRKEEAIAVTVATMAFSGVVGFKSTLAYYGYLLEEVHSLEVIIIVIIAVNLAVDSLIKIVIKEVVVA